MTKEQEKENRILGTIKRVDKQYRESSLYVTFSFKFGVPFLLLFGLWGLIVLYIGSLNNELPPVPTLLTITISFLALFFSINGQLNDEERRIILSYKNYYFITRNYGELAIKNKVLLWRDLFYGVKIPKNSEDPILKALIKIKSKNPEINLEYLYQIDNSIFSKEKIFDTLIYD